MKYIIYILAGLVGVWIGRRWAIARKMKKLKMNEMRGETKEKAKEKVMALFAKQEKVTNDDVEKLLKTSDVTAYRYLEELESENRIKQVGKTGRSVFYEKR